MASVDAALPGNQVFVAADSHGRFHKRCPKLALRAPEQRTANAQPASLPLATRHSPLATRHSSLGAERNQRIRHGCPAGGDPAGKRRNGE